MADVYDCPHAKVCETCPCSAEDDACFPGERLRAERDAYRKALEEIMALDADDANPGFGPTPDYWAGVGHAADIARNALESRVSRGYGPGRTD